MHEITSAAAPTPIPEKFPEYTYWLEHQCLAIQGCYAAVLAVPLDIKTGQTTAQNKTLTQVAVWPDEHIDVGALSKLINQAAEETKGLIHPVAGYDDDHYSVAYPIAHNNELLAVIGLAVKVTRKEQLGKIMKLLEWSSSFFSSIILQNEIMQGKKQELKLSSTITLLTNVMAVKDSATSYMRLISELSHRFDCEWVALGEVKQNTVKLLAYSDSSQQQHKMNQSRLIEAAMEEANDQLTTLAAPDTFAPQDTNLAQKSLSCECQDNVILTVPLLDGNAVTHVVTMLRKKDKAFNSDDALVVESVLALIGPYLFLQHQEQRNLFRILGERSKRQIQRLVGRGYLKRKLVVALLLLFCVLAATLHGEDRISAQAVLTGAKQRMIVAPMSGYISSAQVRAGDQIGQGETVFTLDSADLELERLKWLSHRAKLKGEYQAATAEMDRARMNIIKAQLDQVAAELSLVEHQKTRSVQTAPFDALVVSGDLSQRLGARVDQGEVLFELSPLDTYRVKLKIKQSRIEAVAPHQKGILYLSALPQTPFHFSVTRITPVTESLDGESYYIVEGELSGAQAAALQPGMEGIGKVLVGRDLYLKLWTRSWIDWLRIWYWSLWG